MNCDEARDRMVDRWIKGIDERERSELDAHVAVCPACKAEMEELNPLWTAMGEWPGEAPASGGRRAFQRVLEAYRLGAESAPRRAPVWKAASWRWLLAPALAGAALAVGLIIGHQNGELKQMRHMVALSLLQQQSASDRLRGVSWSMQTAADDQVLGALVETLNTDPNVNVRLAAVDALRQFSASVNVRRGLRESLAHQTSPLVQIALIDWAVDSKDRGSVEKMERLAAEPELNPAVKTRLSAAVEALRERRLQ